MAKDVTLIDINGEKIYPKTYMKNVYDSSGQKTLEDKMVTTDTEQTITGSKTLNAPLIVTGGDASSGVGNIQLDTDGNIIAKGTNSTLLGRSGDNLLVGHSSYPLLLRGKNTRPTYNGTNMAFLGETQKQATSLRTSTATSIEYGSSANQMVQIPLDSLYGSSSSVFTVEDGMLKYNGSAKRGLISFHALVKFPSNSYRDVQVNILRYNTDGTTTGIITSRHAVSSGYTTFDATPHYVQLASGQKYMLRFASGTTNYTATIPAWNVYITIEELY